MLHFAVIDTGASVGFLFKTLKEYGTQLTVVYTYVLDYSTPMGRNLALPELADHVLTLHNKQGIPELIKQLQTLGVTHVICGFDHSVEISDEVAYKINPAYCNPPATSLWRSDKFEMQEALRHAGLNAVKEVKINALENPEQFKAKAERLGYPAVLKPTRSAGSVGVSFINNFAELCSVLKNTVIGFKSEAIEEYTLQEQLVGEEYIVDTVSINSQHVVASVYKYKKENINAHPIYRWADILPNQEANSQIAIDFAKSVLNATQVQNGFAHTELMLTQKGPYLLEINPRLSGAAGMLQKACQFSYGHNQPSLLIKSLTDLKGFLELSQHLPELKMHSRGLFLYCWNYKTMQGLNEACFKNLASYKEHTCWKENGALLEPPTDLRDTVASIILSHADPEQIARDSEIIFEHEHQGDLFL